MGMAEALLKHPDEIPALVQLKIAAIQASRAIPADPSLGFCYKILMRVSRSFSIVIQQLSPALRDAVCVFYLVLRGLDTVEDDMRIPIFCQVANLEGVLQTHIRALLEILLTLKPFVRLAGERIMMDEVLKLYVELKLVLKHHLTVVGRSAIDLIYKIVSSGQKDYKELMNKFHFVSSAFLDLDKGYQNVIAEMTERMGAGMVKFIEADVITVEDYNEYCHYVAGIVGMGLSRLFHASGLDGFQPDELSNSMGLFLQKTNIIRDYLEDINEIPAPRMFWPREIWGKFASRLEDLKHEDNSGNAVRCLNMMITNAPAHAPDCLEYMSAIRDKSNLRFCAIPQLMAIGTLAMCYNNINVFRGVVKIRRGLTAKIMQTKTMSDVYGAFFDFSKILSAKIDDRDDSASATRKYIEEIQKDCEPHVFERRNYSLDRETGLEFLMILVVIVLVIIMGVMLYQGW